MRTIWKYQTASPGTEFVLSLPRDAKCVMFSVQGRSLCAWFILDTDDESVERTFCVYGTGHDFGTALYLKSCIDPPFVWHLCETES